MSVLFVVVVVVYVYVVVVVCLWKTLFLHVESVCTFIRYCNKTENAEKEVAF